MAFHDFRMKKASGCLPEFGTIFMSNRNTKEECFSRRLFGLPLGSADFVKKVKCGMVLFLFEYEQRKLYGVFEAISDGAIDSVPQAYRSSGKLFRAQVQFGVIWKCHPLSEHEFRNAIKDNYYAANKFNFGLSKEQVRRLLWLFESTRVQVHKTLTKKVKRSHSKSSDEWYALGDYTKLEVERNDFAVDVVSPIVSHSWDTETTNFHPQTMCLSDASGSQNSSHGETEQVNSNTVSLVLEDYVIKAPSDNSPKTKGLYSDSPQKRASAFSRLGLVSETAAKEKTYKSEIPKRTLRVLSSLHLAPKAAVKGSKETLEIDKSVHEIMEKLQQRHNSWRKTKENAGSTVDGDENIPLNMRSSVFSRLSCTLEATAEEKVLSAKLDESVNKMKEMSKGKKKNRARKVHIGNDGDYQNSNMTILVTIQGDREMSKRGCGTEKRGGSMLLPEKEERKKRRLSSDGSFVGNENEIPNHDKKVRSEIGLVIREYNSEEKCEVLSNVDSDKLGELDSGARDGCSIDDAVPIPLKTYKRPCLSVSPSVKDAADMEVIVDMAKIEHFNASIDTDEGECCEQNAEQELEFFL
ncbi:hypothetical protein LguiA_016796 [Lonicera macranthoides]